MGACNPRCADIVISVIGWTVWDSRSVRVLTYGTYLGISQKSLEAPITEEDIVKIATSICGLFKDVEERVYRVYLNKSDILREKESAEHMLRNWKGRIQ